MDVPYLDKTIEETSQKIIDLEKNLKQSDVSRKWRKMFGSKMNFGSSKQLGKVLFEGMGYESQEFTKSGLYSTTETNLASVKDPFIVDYLEIKKLKHMNSTYLKGVRKEIIDGYLHPFFNLNRAITYRSSSDSPNFQNIPIRDPILGKMIRSAFIARPGRRLVEIDYGGIEVAIAACYHKDPALIEYLLDPTKDMHRDQATECYLLPDSEMINPIDSADKKRIKMIRYCGKNKFVFPQFYGSRYFNCAKELWNAIDEMKLTLRDGSSIKNHLRKKGITELGECNPDEKPIKGTYEHYIMEVENSFWYDKFFVYSDWKKKWVEKTRKNGYFLTKTGFICKGFMRRNEIINYPVQGSAFHCLLQSLIWLVDTELTKRKMKTLIIGQIHDSIMGDVPDEELSEFLLLANQIMTEKLPEFWKWVVIPLKVEAEVSPVNGNWAEKKEMKIK
jgi:DNA polymerase-1